MEIKDAIKKARKEKKLTQAQLGSLIGVERTTVTQWESGKTIPKRSVAIELSRVLGISPQLIHPLVESNVNFVDFSAAQPNTVKLAWEDLASLQAKGIEYLKEMKATEHIHSDAPDKALLVVRDDSMEPSYNKGDKIVISLSKTPKTGNTVIASIKDKFVLRKYESKGINDNGLEVFDLKSDNINYPTITCNIDDTKAEVLGVVVQLIRDMD